MDWNSRPVYRGLYFNLARDDDVEILGWLLAIPRARRMRAIKAALRTGLPAYATARQLDVIPLPPDAVHAVLGTGRARRSGPAEAHAYPAIPVRARPPERRPSAGQAELDSDPVEREPPARGSLVEAKIDRLLQSFRR